jgi:hypothetical protein
MQQAALAENAEQAMQAKAVAALTSITAPTMVVGIPQYCRQLEQLQLDQVMVVVKPATSVIAGEALEAQNTAVFDRQQQHDFASSVPYRAMEAMLMAEGCQGPPELHHATQQPADLLLTVANRRSKRSHRYHCGPQIDVTPANLLSSARVCRNNRLTMEWC